MHIYIHKFVVINYKQIRRGDLNRDEIAKLMSVSLRGEGEFYS